MAKGKKKDGLRHEVRAMTLGELAPAEANPRIMPARARQALASSLEEFGCVQPLVWNERTGHLVAGHQRRDVLLEKHGEDVQVDVVVVDLDESREKALNVALNSPEVAGEFTAQLDDVLSDIHADLPDLFESLALGDLALEPFDDANFFDDDMGHDDDDVSPDNPREASDVVLVVGEFRIPVERDDYEAWLEDIRQAAGFEKSAIVSEILKRLQLPEDGA